MSFSVRRHRGLCRGRSRSEQGFTLLEVIVALVILSTTGLILFGWVNQNLATATRLQEAQARAQVQLEGLSMLATVNPAVEPEGEREVAGLRLSWRAELVEPMRPEYSFGESLMPRWLLGLYRINARIVSLNTGVSAEWEQFGSGWMPLRAGPTPAGGAGARQ